MGTGNGDPAKTRSALIFLLLALTCSTRSTRSRSSASVQRTPLTQLRPPPSLAASSRSARTACSSGSRCGSVSVTEASFCVNLPGGQGWGKG